MIEVLNLALPFFGLIIIGFACGKIKQIPDTALGWMNFFIVYVSLPALFYRILAQTPLEQLAQVVDHSIGPLHHIEQPRDPTRKGFYFVASRHLPEGG